MAVAVAAALIYQSDRLLVCQRRKGGPFALKWEFPGGKLERGEEYLSALQREIKEELGIEIQAATEVFRHTHAYPGQMEVALRFFRVEEYRGTVANLVFEKLFWAAPSELQELDFLEADLPLVRKIARREL